MVSQWVAVWDPLVVVLAAGWVAGSVVVLVAGWVVGSAAEWAVGSAAC